jgi:hypothetical protein
MELSESLYWRLDEFYARTVAHGYRVLQGFPEYRDHVPVLSAKTWKSAVGG